MANSGQRIIKRVATNDRGMRIGEGHQNAKYSNETVDRIRAMHEDEGFTCAEIAKRLEIPLRTVRSICDYERRAQTVEGFIEVEEWR